MTTERARRARDFLASRREDAHRTTLERVTVDQQTGDWLDLLTNAIEVRRSTGLPVKANGTLDLRRRMPPWLQDASVARAVSARRLALVICDAILRPRANEPEDFIARELPSPLTVADDIGRSLGVKGGDRRESKRLREEFGMDLLGIAAECGLIDPLRVEGRRSRATARVRLTVAAEARLAEIYTALVVSGDLRTDQVVFDPPEPLVVVSSNIEGWDETPANVTPGVVQALDAAQQTGWRVNRKMLAHLVGNHDPVAEVRVAVIAAREASRVLAVSRHDGYKIRKALKKTPKSTKLAHQLTAIESVRAGLEHAVERTLADFRKWLAITQATALHDRTFYYRYRFDYRGRMYSVGGMLNYTGGDDLVRSLIEFAERETLEPGSRSVAMLSVHLTAMLGNSVDKAPLQDRMNWAASHSEEIVAHAAGMPYPGVREIGEPFRFRAACLAWSDYLAGRPVHLPVVFDATSSGLQIYSLLMRDAALGARVNTFRELQTPKDNWLDLEPSTDIAVTAHTSPPRDFYAEVGALACEDERGIVKLLTNPQIYGAGVKKQCRILAEELIADWRDETIKQRVRRVRNAVKQLAPAFVTVARWLKRCARLFSERDEPFHWTLPDGFVVLQDSRVTDEDRVRFSLPGYNRQVEYVRKHATRQIDGEAQRKQVAANYVHSLDAALLRAVVRQGSEHGVKAWALAHDSFGCLPSQAVILLAVLRPAFQEVFGPSPLNALAEQFHDQGVEEPSPVHPAMLDVRFMFGDLVS